MSLFTTIQVYEEDSAIVFKIPSESAPFAVFPKCAVKIRDYRSNGILFEETEDSNDIACVENYADILDATSTPYGATKAAVYSALNAFLCNTASVLENLAELANFDMIPGNNINITYYPNVPNVGNPSGNSNNIYTIVYTTGATVIATKTLSYNAADNVISVITT